MRIKAVFALLVISAFCNLSVNAQSSIDIMVDGQNIPFSQEPINLYDKTLVQLRPIAEALKLDITFIEKYGNVILSNENTTVVFTKDLDKLTVNDEVYQMDVPMIIYNDYTFVPVRELAEPFGFIVGYDENTKTVTINSPIVEEEPDEVTDSEQMQSSVSQDEVITEIEVIPPARTKKVIPDVFSTGSGKYKSVFFYQSQPEFELENNGKGYCWACSYAMLLSNICNDIVTPGEVANINIDNGYNGNYMSPHKAFVSLFGCRLVPALSEDSEFFGAFDSLKRGETTLNITSEEDAKAAICEALDNFPYGVLVRYEGYPHTMLAVGYDDENIYFNDPALKNGEHITFEQTVLHNFNLSDISFVQAIEVK